MSKILEMSLSIILPTLDEKENLEFLIPEIKKVLEKSIVNTYEIIVVDDSSKDGTAEFIKFLNKEDSRVKLITRKEEKSLPKSIHEGIVSARYQYVMWLDADGSMDAVAVKKLINAQLSLPNSVIVGSRFVPDGGYKGIQKNEKFNFLKYIRGIANSEDSVLAIILSKYFNKIMGRILDIGVLDLTSGFIVGKKEYFIDDVYSNAAYGEYFLFLMKNLHHKNVDIKEVGYYCKPRYAGKSKTSTNYLVLLKLSVPYIKAAINNKKKNI
jgi:dolichol-phosphate mannosyltransferase